MKRVPINSFIDTNTWGSSNIREYKSQLVKDFQKCVNDFSSSQKSHNPKNPIQVLDFFSGAGGTSLGFAAANKKYRLFNILGGIDINYTSANTYSSNFGTPLLNEDIRALASDTPKLNTLLEKIGYDPEKPLILIGCAPCQGFSSHRKKDWNKEEDVRNSLILAFAKIVQHISPDVVLIENVPEFLSTKYWHYFSAAKTAFESCGYIVKQNIYDAASFGVPQERFRSIVVAMKKDFLMPEGYLTRNEYKTVRDAIGNLPAINAGQVDPNDELHRCANHKLSTIDVIRQVPHDGGNRPIGVGPKCLDKTKGFSDTYGRLFWDKPSITITHYSRNPASGRFSHPEQDRGLSAREVALLQSFPYAFHFSGKSDDVYRQIGEAVPPLLSAAVAANIIIELFSSAPTEDEVKNNIQPILSPVSSSYSSVIAGIKVKK